MVCGSSISNRSECRPGQAGRSAPRRLPFAVPASPHRVRRCESTQTHAKNVDPLSDGGGTRVRISARITEYPLVDPDRAWLMFIERRWPAPGREIARRRIPERYLDRCSPPWQKAGVGQRPGVKTSIDVAPSWAAAAGVLVVAFHLQGAVAMPLRRRRCLVLMQQPMSLPPSWLRIMRA